MRFTKVSGVGRDKDPMGQFHRANLNGLKTMRKLRVGRSV